VSFDEAVTVVVRRRVSADTVDAFEDWPRGITEAAARFEGHAGALVLRPDDPAHEDYVLLFRYATAAQLAHWERSEERAAWLARAEPFTVGEARVDRVTGLGYWFQIPGDGARKPPPRYKMAEVAGPGSA
jgi:antibiotic biosynthesis monooxygenase (ABM) superfamily enzyme